MKWLSAIYNAFGQGKARQFALIHWESKEYHPM